MEKEAGPKQDAEHLATLIKQYVSDHATTEVRQGGVTLFTVASVDFSVDVGYRRCLIYCWSDNLNLRRTVVGAEEVKGCLRLTVSRLGTNKKEVLWLAPGGKTDLLSAIESARRQYLSLLKDALYRSATGANLLSMPRKRENVVSARIKGTYVLGHVKDGVKLWAFVGVGQHESSVSINGVLRAGLLWLIQCRTSTKTRSIAGLRVICPAGCSVLIAQREAWLAHGTTVEVYEMDDEGKEFVRIPCDRDISCEPTIGRTFNQDVLIKRCMGALAKLLMLLPPGAANRLDLQPLTPSLLSVRLNGLEFASVRYGPGSDSLKLSAELYWSSSRGSVRLSGAEVKRSFPLHMIALFEDRQAEGVRTSSYYRTGADAWLAKQIRPLITQIDPSIVPGAIYPSVASTSHGVWDFIDFLAITSAGQLVIFSIRTDEQRILPLHGLDQWIRVRELNRTGALRRAGYFTQHHVTEQDPRLVFMAPAFRLRKMDEDILRAISGDIEWTFIGVDERWRTTSGVIYRKRPSDTMLQRRAGRGPQAAT